MYRQDGWTRGAERNGRIWDEEHVGTPEQKRRGDLLPDQFGKQGGGTKARRAAGVEKLADAMLRGNFPQGAQEVDDVEADARILSGGFPNVKGNLHVGDFLRR